MICTVCIPLRKADGRHTQGQNSKGTAMYDLCRRRRLVTGASEMLSAYLEAPTKVVAHDIQFLWQESREY